jgi:hypothetical protein
MSPARAIKCPEKNQNWVLQGGATITFNAFISKAELQQTRRDCFAREAGNGPQERRGLAFLRSVSGFVGPTALGPTGQALSYNQLGAQCCDRRGAEQVDKRGGGLVTDAVTKSSESAATYQQPDHQDDE